MVCVVEGKKKIKIHFLSYCTCSLNNAQRLRGLEIRENKYLNLKGKLYGFLLNNTLYS